VSYLSKSSYQDSLVCVQDNNGDGGAKKLPDTSSLLVLGGKLNTATLISLRRNHQTKFAEKAVRRAMTSATITVQTNSLSSVTGESDLTATSDVDFRQQLKEHLRSVVPSLQMGNSTSGVGRQIRHSGIYSSTTDGTDTRTQNKNLVTGIAAKACFFILR
jgi:hypothetical protein